MVRKDHRHKCHHHRDSRGPESRRASRLAEQAMQTDSTRTPDTTAPESEEARRAPQVAASRSAGCAWHKRERSAPPARYNHPSFSTVGHCANNAISGGADGHGDQQHKRRVPREIPRDAAQPCSTTHGACECLTPAAAARRAHQVAAPYVFPPPGARARAKTSAPRTRRW